MLNLNVIDFGLLQLNTDGAIGNAIIIKLRILLNNSALMCVSLKS